MIDILLLIILFSGIFLSFRKNNVTVRFDAMLFFGLGFIIHVGLRDINFGEDSINYFNNYFLNSHEYRSISEFISSGDIFFRFINYLLLFFSSNWYFYSLSMACICLYFVIKINNSIERKVFFYTALILTNPVFIENTTNILRSTLCSLILLFSYLSYQHKIKNIVIIILGFLTHYLHSLMLFVVFLPLIFLDLIKNNKNKNIFTTLLFIAICFKTFSSVLIFEFLNGYFEIINLFLFDNEIQSYTLNQILSDKSRIPINIFFQLLLYCIVPLFLIKYDALKSHQKKLLNFVLLSLTAYAFLFPQITFALRLIPSCILGVTYIFTIQMDNYKKYYTTFILFFNFILIIYNLK